MVLAGPLTIVASTPCRPVPTFGALDRRGPKARCEEIEIMANRIRRALDLALALTPIWAVTLALGISVNMRRW